jgi:hypothetical protein
LQARLLVLSQRPLPLRLDQCLVFGVQLFR